MPSRTRSHRLAGFALIALTVALGAARCAGGGAVARSRDARAAWATLQDRRSAFDGARSYLKVRVRSERLRRSFNARLLVDGQGRILLSGLSPLGTAIFTLWVDGDRVVMIDHHERTYWRGSTENLAGVAGLEGAFRARGLGLLLFGLPPGTAGSEWSPRGDQFGLVRSGGWNLVVSASGIAEATATDGDGRVRFDLPSIPPTRVTLDSGADDGDQIEIEVLDLEIGPTTVAEPEIDPGYVAIDADAPR